MKFLLPNIKKFEDLTSNNKNMKLLLPNIKK